MLGLIKTFGKGILYVITFPLVVLVLAFYGICGLFAFIYLSIKSVILFFQGKTIYSELEEDKRAHEILLKMNNIPDTKEEERPIVEIINATPNPTYYNVETPEIRHVEPTPIEHNPIPEITNHNPAFIPLEEPKEIDNRPHFVPEEEPDEIKYDEEDR